MELHLALKALVIIISALSQGKTEEQDMDTVIGIDLGTTYSCVGIYKNGQVEIIPNDQGNYITPSYVSFTAEGKPLIGDSAKSQLIENPVNTIFNFKRLVGREWGEASVEKDIKYLPFEVFEKNWKPYIKVSTSQGSKNFAPEEISAMVLIKMKEIAEAYLSTTVTGAVISVPAYFNNAQRQATKNAGVMAGLNIIRIINDPSAAAIAYGYNTNEKKNILVFDLGGGTFDVSFLTIDNGVIKVIATKGNTQLGGEDIDQRMMEYYIKLYEKEKGEDIRIDNYAIQKLRHEVQKAKQFLSSSDLAKIEIESFFKGEKFSATLTRDKFEQINMDLFQSAINLIKIVLEDAHMNKTDVDEIVLVGGSTQIPKVQQLVEEFFEGTEQTFGIVPDEAVVYGAAIQASTLAGKHNIKPIVLFDVNPLTFVYTTSEGDIKQLIPRNTVIPTKQSAIFSAVAYDKYVAVIEVEIYECEHAMVIDNNFMSKYYIFSNKASLDDSLKTEILFEIDANGIFQIPIEHIDQNRVTLKDIDKMIYDANKIDDLDERIKMVVETLNSYGDVVVLSDDQLIGLKELLMFSEDDAINSMNRIFKGISKGIDNGVLPSFLLFQNDTEEFHITDEL